LQFGSGNGLSKSLRLNLGSADSCLCLDGFSLDLVSQDGTNARAQADADPLPRAGISWLLFAQVKTCGDARGTVLVDAPVTEAGEHFVFELRRLPYHENDPSATRAIPDDSDKDEGPSGVLYYYANASSTAVSIPVKKIELKGRTPDPRLKDAYAFDIDSDNSEKIGFPDAGKCGDYVLR